MAIALMQYCQDADEMLPPGAIGSLPSPPPVPNRWNKFIYPYTKSVDVYTCPSKNEGGSASLPFVAQIDPANGLPNSCGGYGANYNLMHNIAYTDFTGNNNSETLTITM